MSIRQNWETLWHIRENDQWQIVTEWIVWENTYKDFIELIQWLQWFNIQIDDFYF